MANVDDERKILRLTDYTFEQFQHEGIELTEQASRFVKVVIEALIKEPPRSHTDQPRFTMERFQPGGVAWECIARDILGTALRDPRIRRDMESQSAVSFFTILRVVSDEGYTLLQNIGFK